MTFSNEPPEGGTVTLMRDLSNKSDIVDVIVPVNPRYAATLRTMAATFGVDTGFSIDEIDDFKLAVTEAFSMLGLHHGDQRTVVSFAMANSTLSVRLSLEAGGEISVEPDELGLAILRAVVDTYEVGRMAITFNKQATETSM